MSLTLFFESYHTAILNSLCVCGVRVTYLNFGTLGSVTKVSMKLCGRKN